MKNSMVAIMIVIDSSFGFNLIRKHTDLDSFFDNFSCKRALLQSVLFIDHIQSTTLDMFKKKFNDSFQTKFLSPLKISSFHFFMNLEEKSTAINLLYEIAREIKDPDEIEILTMAIHALMGNNGTKTDENVDIMVTNYLTMKGVEPTVVNQKSMAVSLSQETQLPLPRILEMTKIGRNKWFKVLLRRHNNLFQ